MTLPLQVSEIDKSFLHRKQRAKVLDAVSLDVKPKSILGLIGLNGAGKTTLIKIIIGLMKADQGTVKLFNSDTLDTETRRRFCYLPEKFTPSAYLKGYEFLDLTLSYYHKKIDAALARDYSQALDLDPQALERKIGQYSKGMTQKLGLISALLIDAPLLILDEPMSGLDPRARIFLKDALKRYTKNGNSIFFSSHILSDIDEICSHIAIMHEAQISFTGTPAQFKKKYKNASLERAFLAAIK